LPEKRYYATGKRKTAVARVWIKQGAGEFLINGRKIEDYFPVEELKLVINIPVPPASSMLMLVFMAAEFRHKRGP
jgi:small subunit ribosomal protein S9